MAPHLQPERILLCVLAIGFDLQMIKLYLEYIISKQVRNIQAQVSLCISMRQSCIHFTCQEVI